MRLNCDLGEDVGAVDGDPARPQQVLWNLIRNAAKFTPQGARLTVTTARSSDTERATVADTGIGIPRDDLARVFDAFEQGDTAVTREFGGMGLGLAISKSIVELHGGTIRADSAGPGLGATFTVELPAPPLPAALTAPGGNGNKPGNGDGGGLRLLLVEDHVDTARLLAPLLGHSGYNVRFVHTAADALSLAGREPFDLVVSDIGLPDGTGYDLMKQLRARHGLTGIAMSGYGMDDDLRRSRDAGFADHLVKPVSVDHLERVLRRVATAVT